MDAQFPQKLECLFQPKRYKVLYGGRGAGRSWGVARALLLIGQMKKIRVLCVRELQKSIEDSVHKLLSDQIAELGLEAFFSIGKTKIEGRNGTSFSFDGIKNNVNAIKSYEGIDYCWAEEANKISKNSWSVLIPTIRKEGSEIWITFNPELDEDYTYSRFVSDIDEDDAPFIISSFMTWRDNPWFPEVLKSDMERDRRKDYDHYLNVWEGQTRQNLEGAVYAKELRRVASEARICDVPYEREIPVDAFWDLGRADNTAIWFMQQVGMQYRVLHYYEGSFVDITEHLKEVQKLGFLIGTMWLPHDAKAKVLGTKHSIEEIVRRSYASTRLVPKLSKLDGINAAREMFDNCWFNESTTKDGIRALRHYKYQVVNGQISNEPLHNWASDGADAFRYMAVARRIPREHKGNGIIAKLQAVKSSWSGTAASNLGWMQ